MNPLHRKLQVLRLPEMIELELAKYGYKITNQLYLTKIHTTAEANGGLKQHQYATRFKRTPNIQKHGKAEFNASFLCKGLSIFNNLPNKIQNLRNLKQFTSKARKHFLLQYV